MKQPVPPEGACLWHCGSHREGHDDSSSGGDVPGISQEVRLLSLRMRTISTMPRIVPYSAALMSFCASHTSPWDPKKVRPSSGLTSCANHDSRISHRPLNPSIVMIGR